MVEDENNFESLEVSLIDSIAKGEIKGLAADFGEISLDALLDDGLLQSIPVVGTVARIYRATISIRDRLFLRKVLLFLREFADFSQAERKAFADRLDADEGSRENAGAALTLLLDRLDDLGKPAIGGRLYLARLNDIISFDELRRFCMILERAHLPDLIALARLPTGARVDSIAAPYLEALGLASITGQDYGTFDGIGAETWYEVNEQGIRFLSIAFQNQHSSE